MTQDYVAYWKRQRARQRRKHHALAQMARRDAVKVAQMLRECFPVTRIIMFGSLVKGRFTAESDIDLAVEGLASSDLFEAMAAVNRLSDFQVDLKPLEELDFHFRQRVLEQGKEL